MEFSSHPKPNELAEQMGRISSSTSGIFHYREMLAVESLLKKKNEIKILYLLQMVIKIEKAG
jgi:hypothetical protein